MCIWNIKQSLAYPEKCVEQYPFHQESRCTDKLSLFIYRTFALTIGSAKVPARYKHDVLALMDFADVPIGDSAEDVSPVGLLGSGEHFDDIDGGRRGATTRACYQNERGNPAVCMPPNPHVTTCDRMGYTL